MYVFVLAALVFFDPGRISILENRPEYLVDDPCLMMIAGYRAVIIDESLYGFNAFIGIQSMFSCRCASRNLSHRAW